MDLYAFPTIESLVVYGLPVAVVVSYLSGIIGFFVSISERTQKVVNACGIAVGYLLSANLPRLEVIAPGIATWLPQVLITVVLFGVALGVTPNKIFRLGRSTVRALMK